MYLLVNVLKFVAVYLATGLVMPWVYAAIIEGVLIHRYGLNVVLNALKNVHFRIESSAWKALPITLLTWPVRYPPSADQCLTMFDSICKEYKETRSEKEES